MPRFLKFGGEGPVGRFEGLRALRVVADYPARHASTLVALEATLTSIPDPLKGNPLTNTPKHSMSLWSTYQLNDWSFGYGATYQGGFYTQNSSPLGDLDPYKT